MYDRPGLFPGVSWSSTCALALILYRTNLLAIPPSFRRYGFWAQSPATGLSCWSQLLTLPPCSLPPCNILHMSQAGHLKCWSCILSCPYCQAPVLPAKAGHHLGLNIPCYSPLSTSCESRKTSVLNWRRRVAPAVLVAFIPAGRARRAVVLGVVSGLTHLIS